MPASIATLSATAFKRHGILLGSDAGSRAAIGTARQSRRPVKGEGGGTCVAKATLGRSQRHGWGFAADRVAHARSDLGGQRVPRERATSAKSRSKVSVRKLARSVGAWDWAALIGHANRHCCRGLAPCRTSRQPRTRYEPSSEAWCRRGAIAYDTRSAAKPGRHGAIAGPHACGDARGRAHRGSAGVAATAFCLRLQARALRRQTAENRLRLTRFAPDGGDRQSVASCSRRQWSLPGDRLAVLFQTADERRLFLLRRRSGFERALRWRDVMRSDHARRA